MENASKALLIAGAILVVILIIAVGMIVYNSSRGTIDEAVSQMSAQEVSMYNSQFTSYAGTRVNGSTVRSLLDNIRTNNTKNNGVGAKQVTLRFQDGDIAAYSSLTEAAPDAVSRNIITSKFYTVSCFDAQEGTDSGTTYQDGLISAVTIEAQH